MRRDAKSDAKLADDAAKLFCNSVQYYDFEYVKGLTEEEGLMDLRKDPEVLKKGCKNHGWFIGLVVVLVIIILLVIGYQCCRNFG